MRSPIQGRPLSGFYHIDADIFYRNAFLLKTISNLQSVRAIRNNNCFTIDVYLFRHILFKCEYEKKSHTIPLITLIVLGEQATGRGPFNQKGNFVNDSHHEIFGIFIY